MYDPMPDKVDLFGPVEPTSYVTLALRDFILAEFG